MEIMENITIDKVAFEGVTRGYNFKATYLIEPKGMALIEITKDDKMIKEFLFPAYKLWNIAAHANDIVDGLERESDSGLFIAGSNGLGGNAYNPSK
jgi:hypothetical protein